MILVEQIREIVSAMGTSYFMSGTRKEINKRLLRKTNRYDKYPLIVLYTPFNGTPESGMMKYSLNLSILEFTNREMNAEERMLNKFATVLLPLYDQFIKELRDTGNFAWPGNILRPPHDDFVQVPYWGVAESAGKAANFYTDPLDAIVITGMKINEIVGCEDYVTVGQVPQPPTPEIPAEGSYLKYKNGVWQSVPVQEVANDVSNAPVE